MDNVVTTGEVSVALATTRSRIHRAVAAGVVRPGRTKGGHLRFTLRDVAILEKRLGRSPRVEGLSREEGRVLAALARRPFGLRSKRAVGRAAGISPTSASRLLDRLHREGLVKRQTRMVVSGRVGEVEVWKVDVTHPRWRKLSPALARVVLPARHEESGDVKLPGWLRHLFWNVDVNQLDVERDGAFIAGRVLASEDAQAHAWAVTTLRSEVFQAAASVRGLDPQRRALALNLSASTGS